MSAADTVERGAERNADIGKRKYPWRAAVAHGLALLMVAGLLAISDVGPAAAAGSLRLVSHTPASPTTTGSFPSSPGMVSADGRFVVFASNATNLVAGLSDSNADSDVFLFERATGAVTLGFPRHGQRHYDRQRVQLPDIHQCRRRVPDIWIVGHQPGSGTDRRQRRP